jgi:hypothetical protein
VPNDRVGSLGEIVDSYILKAKYSTMHRKMLHRLIPSPGMPFLDTRRYAYVDILARILSDDPMRRILESQLTLKDACCYGKRGKGNVRGNGCQ